MAELEGLKLGFEVRRCDECEYRNDPNALHIDLDKEILLLEPDMAIALDVQERIVRRVAEQAKTGVVLIPYGFKAIVAPKGTYLQVKGDDK